jgi:hypothetical protein
MASYCAPSAEVASSLGAKFCAVCGANAAAASPQGVAAVPLEKTVASNDRHGGRAGMVVRRIAPVSAAKIQGTLMALLGFLFGLMFAAIGSIASVASQQSSSPLAFMGAPLAVGVRPTMSAGPQTPTA